MNCPKCNKIIPADAKSCCGITVSALNRVPEPSYGLGAEEIIMFIISAWTLYLGCIGFSIGDRFWGWTFFILTALFFCMGLSYYNDRNKKKRENYIKELERLSRL